jgi:hypothetical protein
MAVDDPPPPRRKGFLVALSASNSYAASRSHRCIGYRHTFASQLAMRGESLFKISKLMGNSPEICRRHYAALLPESLVESVEFGRPAHLSGAAASPT